MKRLLNSKNRLFQSKLVQNSAWGVLSNLFQILFVSLFFIIVARKYNPDEFGRFLIANTVYQLVAAFSSMGLGQWFIRQYVAEENKIGFTGKFFKTQIGLGLFFYAANIGFAYLMYGDVQIRMLCIILGTNIVFDNFINAIRTLNIAENEQRKTALILGVDGFLKLIVGGLLLIQPFSTLILAAAMILVRIMTVGLFIKIGSSSSINLTALWKAPVSIEDLKILIIKNWQFIVIGSISIIYWKIGNLIISKMLSLHDVADYEVSFRIFSIFQILPVVASATIYPQFIRYYNEKNFTALKGLFSNVFTIYTLVALASYTFIYAFAPYLIPIAFGKGYPGAVLCLQQMFLTFLLMPTVLLQANIIVAIGLEKKDMLFNIFSLIVSVAGCFIGLYFTHDLSAINYAVVASFVVFHLLQDAVLIRRKIMSIQHCLVFYLALGVTILVCNYGAMAFNPFIFCLLFFAGLVMVAIGVFLFNKKSNMLAENPLSSVVKENN